MRLHDVEIDDKKVRENVQIKLIDRIITHFDRESYYVVNNGPMLPKRTIMSYLKNKKNRIVINSKEGESQDEKI